MIYAIKYYQMLFENQQNINTVFCFTEIFINKCFNCKVRSSEIFAEAYLIKSQEVHLVYSVC